MTITKFNLAVVSILFSGWFFVNSYFAHSADFEAMKVDNQVQNWTTEQGMNYLHQGQAKRALREEMRQKNPDPIEVQDLKDRYDRLKQRGKLLEQLKDKAALEKIKYREQEKSNPIVDIVSELI